MFLTGREVNGWRGYHVLLPSLMHPDTGDKGGKKGEKVSGEVSDVRDYERPPKWRISKVEQLASLTYLFSVQK